MNGPGARDVPGVGVDAFDPSHSELPATDSPPGSTGFSRPYLALVRAAPRATQSLDWLGSALPEAHVVLAGPSETATQCVEASKPSWTFAW